MRHLTGAAAISLGLLPFGVFAQQPEPDYFAGAEDAAPLTEADAQSPPPTQAEVLRWKSPRAIVNPYVGPRVVQAAASAPLEDEQEPRTATSGSPSGHWNRSRISGHQGAARPVRLAAHDPFSDPFGDRLTPGEAPTLSAPRYETEAAVAQQPDTPQPGAGELPPPAEEGARPMFSDRDYSPEICRQWQEGCKALGESLLSDRITAISLNITPPYELSPREGVDMNEHRRQQLALLPSRDWRSKTGAVLASGRLGNVEFGQAIIIDDAGGQVASLSLRELGTDEICYIAHYWHVPYHCYAADRDPAPRNWVASTFTYQASNLCHKPLYFEEVQLERYGHTAGPIKQPIISGAHFFANIAVLPYKMAISPPMECEYALGYYRPGSCAPWHIPPIPFSLRGALAEAGAWVGGIYIIP